jgi:radical SAM superfamily enzyme YgiQ (UPF0313 family)
METPETKLPYSFEVGMYRPPSEGGSFSLLLRVTRNCPWNKCTFCGMYKTEKFKPRSVDEVKADIDSIAALCEQTRSISARLGYGGELNRHVVTELLDSEPSVGFVPGLEMVINWMASGGRTAFLQDGDSIALKSDRLVEILVHLRTTFPSIERVTTYARGKTVFKKSLEELTQIREAGLTRLHIGLESGDDELLERIMKGVTSEEHIIAGRKAMEAGFQLSEYWMPGLGGKERWRQHAENTARVLNEIDPDYARSRPFFPYPGTPIADEFEQGNVTLLTPYEHLREIQMLVEKLDYNGRVCFDHAGNHWRSPAGGNLLSLDYEGYKLPEEKEHLVELIDAGLAILEPPITIQ